MIFKSKITILIGLIAQKKELERQEKDFGSSIYSCDKQEGLARKIAELQHELGSTTNRNIPTVEGEERP